MGMGTALLEKTLEKKQKRFGQLLGLLPGLETLPPSFARKLYVLLDRTFGLPKQKMMKVVNHQVPLKSQPGNSIALRAYYPSSSCDSAMVYFHGGGCVIGSIASHDRICRYMAVKTNTIIISVEYRLAPEFKFPTAIIDAIEAWNWINEHPQELAIPADNIGVGGDSAGAYLALLISQHSSQQSLPVQSQKAPRFQMLLYPMLDLTAKAASYQTHTKNLILTRDLMLYFRDHYLNNAEEQNLPLASPLMIEDLSHSPKTFLLTLGYDPLVDEGLLMAQRFQQQGVDIVHKHYDDCMHSFISLARLSHRARQVSDETCDALMTLTHRN